MVMCQMLHLCRNLQLMAEEQGLEVSIEGFNQCMDQQRERSRVG